MSDNYSIDMPGAQLIFGWNEITLAEKQAANDPTKFRIGGWVDPGQNGYLGALSLNQLEGSDDNLTQREKILLAFKLDPDPTVEIYLQRRRDTTEDIDMVKVLRLTPTVLETYVPLKTKTDTLTSVNGRFVTLQQDDGNLVTYRATNGVINQPLQAVWASGFVE